MIRERERQTTPGLLMLVVFLTIMVFAAFTFVGAVREGDDGTRVAIASVFVFVLSILGLTGLFTVAPNEGRVLQLPCLRLEGLVIWGLTYRMFASLESLLAPRA